MTWDPTDQQGWKRALDGSTSPSTPAQPTKKVRFSTTNASEVAGVSNSNFRTDKNIDTAQTVHNKETPASCALSTAEPVPMRSFFRPKKLRPLPVPTAEITHAHVDTQDSAAAGASIRAQGVGELYDVLLSQNTQLNTSFDEVLTSSDASMSAGPADFNQYVNTPRSSSSKIGNVNANSTTSASSSFTQPDVPTPATTTAVPLQVEGTLNTGAFAKPHHLSARASTPTIIHQGFLFGNGGDDLDRGSKSDYFDKIKNNPYTSALQPRAPSPGMQVPHNATEARELFKKGRYNKPKRDSVPEPTIEELEKALQNLRMRFAKLKAMCETAGIVATPDVWDKISAVVHGERPDIKVALAEDTGNGLNEYMDQLERWDKAVGHHAIVMKRLNYKQQIAVLEKKVNEAKVTAAVIAMSSEQEDDDNEAGKGNGSEWKGHKTRLGRRFSGLIEKN
jgi:hypothetical protein